MTLSYVEGLRTAMSVGSAWSQSYGYDSAWRMTSLASPAGTFGYGYGAPSAASALVRTISLPNFATITNHYDSLARLASTALVNRWGHVLDGYGYTHDLLGLRTNLTRDFGLTTSSVAAGYDNINQLTKWTAKEANNALRPPLRRIEHCAPLSGLGICPTNSSTANGIEMGAE